MSISNNAALGGILVLNQRYGAACDAGKLSEREKLAVMAGGWLHLQEHGGLAKTGPSWREATYTVSDEIAGLLTAQNIKNKVSALNHCAQLVMGLVIETITDTTAKKAARNAVGRGEKLFAALDYFGTVGDLPEDEAGLTDWLEGMGGVDGTVAEFKKKSAAAIGEEEPEEPEDDTSGEEVAEIATALDLNGVTISCDEVFGARPTVGIIRMDEEGRLRVLPLPAVTGEAMTSLLPFLPAPDALLPDAHRFWGAATACCDMLGRFESEEVARPTEEQHEASRRMMSYPIIQLTDQRRVTIASSRVTTGIVCHLITKGDTGLPQDIAGRHINGRGTSLLSQNLSGGVSRAMYNGLEWDKALNCLTFRPRDTRYKPFNVFTLPIEKFGSSVYSNQWTLDVPGIKQDARASITDEEGLPADVVKWAGKAALSKHPVVVRIGKEELSLALGKSGQPLTVAADEVTGDATAEVAGADLARVVQLAADLRLQRVGISIDKGGLLLLSGSNRILTLQLFVPTLLKSAVPNPARMVRVERPVPVPDIEPETAPVEDAEKAAA